MRYQIDLLGALDRDPRVRQVELVTRRIFDPRISDDCAVANERLPGKAGIRRVACAPRRQIRKEVPWPHLPEFIDGALDLIRMRRQLPDVLHAHDADAGFVAARLSKVRGIPIIFTGHCLATTIS